MKVLVAGGGTGGHVVPALAVSAALRERGANLLYVGSRAPLDRQLVEASGVPFKAIYTGKLRRYFSWQNLSDPLKVLLGFFQSLVVVGRFKPDVVFGKGGFVTVPVIRAARLWRVPVVLHESDVLPGLANRLGAGVATTIAVSFPVEEVRGLPPEKLVFTGNPIGREALTSQAGRAQKRFRLERGLPVVLVVGGSQGSASLNALVTAALPALLSQAQVVHQVGQRSATEYVKQRQAMEAGARRRYHVRAYLENPDLFDLYAAADVIIARAGAGVLGGIAAAGKPAVLVPLPKRVSGHQAYNAAYYADHGAAVVLDQEQADGATLTRVVRQLLQNPQRRAEMGRQAHRLATPEATERLTELIWQAAKPAARERRG